MAEHQLPAEPFAEAVRSAMSGGDLTLEALADSLAVHPGWLGKVLAGEVTELSLLTVVGICRRLRVMPEQIWDAEEVAWAFHGFGPGAFDPDEA